MPEENEVKIVDFLDLDVNKITFSLPKANKHGGSQIGIRYEGRVLYVKYEGVTPFGIKENYDKDGNYYGISMQINASDEYARKACEIDDFFIHAFLKNKWGLNKNIKHEAISGYDEHGEGGLWKRILKKSYRLKNNVREYLDYPSKLEFAPYFNNDKLLTKFFTWNKVEVENYTDVTPGSNVKFIAAWFSLSRGNFGLSLKPKLMQVRFKERENNFNVCLLDDDEEEQPGLIYNIDDGLDLKYSPHFDGYEEYP